MKIAAVVVTFNRKKLLLKTIQSLKTQSRKIDTIYIVDNASTDGTYEYLIKHKLINRNKIEKSKVFKCKTDNIIYLRIPYNSGGAGGFYEGIKAAHKDYHEWIWVMDDDVSADKNALMNYEKIIISSTEEIGALMGLRNYKDIPFSFESTHHDFENYKELDFKQNYISSENMEEHSLIRIYDMPFEGPIINSKIIDKIGYPNKDFFIIGDDTEYSIKINKYAPIYLTPTVRINRMITPYSEYKFGWKEFYTIRNIIYLNKVYGKNNKVKYLRTFNIYKRHMKEEVKKGILKKDIRYIRNSLKITEAYILGIIGIMGKKYTPDNF